jgi:hypothetical protein
MYFEVSNKRIVPMLNRKRMLDTTHAGHIMHLTATHLV